MNENHTSPETLSAATPPPPVGEAIDTKALEERIIEVMKTVYDPEIPVNIYELGMVYKVDVRADAEVFVQMTLTSPSCPVAGSLPGEVEARVKTVPGVRKASLELVWDPPWTPAMMTEAAKLQLGMM